MENETAQGPGEPDRSPPRVEEEGAPGPHTSPEEGHPAGDGERTDRDVGGPTIPREPSSEDEAG